MGLNHPKPVLHGRDHQHGGPDPTGTAWEKPAAASTGTVVADGTVDVLTKIKWGTGITVTDEGQGGVCQANAIARLPDPLSAHLIMDDAMWQAEPKLTTTVAANPAMVTAGGPLVSAGDLAALAARIDVPVEALAETVRAHNHAVAANDFARLATPRSVKKHRPMAFAVPPYHAVPLCAGVTGTMGGVVIDAQARAQRREGGVFPGLYAVGTPVAGLEGGPRAGYVGGLSKAFILGMLAAEDAAKVTATA